MQPEPVTQRVTAVLLVALTITMVGCGDDRPPPAPPPAPEVAPLDGMVVGSPAEAVRDPEVVLAEVRALGLDRLQLAEPGPEPVLPGTAAPRDARVVGPPAPPIAESRRRIDRASPDRLLGTALAALSEGDVAALARLSRPVDRRPALDQDDADDAERRFLTAQARSLWSRIGAAARAGRVEVVPAGPAAAVLRIQVGGALGSVEVRLTKEADGWYLAS